MSKPLLPQPTTRAMLLNLQVLVQNSSESLPRSSRMTIPLCDPTEQQAYPLRNHFRSAIKIIEPTHSSVTIAVRLKCQCSMNCVQKPMNEIDLPRDEPILEIGCRQCQVFAANKLKARDGLFSKADSRPPFATTIKPQRYQPTTW
jgi:hypothetical protein